MLENQAMNQIYGGAAYTITLDTVTVTPEDVSNDGDDSWSGESDGALPPANLDHYSDNVFTRGDVGIIDPAMLDAADQAEEAVVFSAIS